MSTTQQQKEYYEKYWAEGRTGYSGDSQGYAANFRNWMHAELKDLPRDAKLLEVGCGDGAFTKTLAEYSQYVTAIDISASQIEQNSKHYPEIFFLQHDVSERLPFEDESFDAIWCSEVLEHLFDPGFALGEMYRVKVRDGRLLVTVPYHGRINNLQIAMLRLDENIAPTQPSGSSRGTRCATGGQGRFTGIETHTCGMNRPLQDLFVPRTFSSRLEAMIWRIHRPANLLANQRHHVRIAITSGMGTAAEAEHEAKDFIGLGLLFVATIGVVGVTTVSQRARRQPSFSWSRPV
jgi:SAM-dependent methyltransferase